MKSDLAAENKLDEFVPVDPVKAVNNRQTAEHPPTVANVFQFFRSTIKSSVW